MIEIGPTLASVIGGLITAGVTIFTLWIKTSANHAETTAAVSAIADKVDEVHAATVDNTAKVAAKV